MITKGSREIKTFVIHIKGILDKTNLPFKVESILFLLLVWRAEIVAQREQKEHGENGQED
jgi:hypothetical protein